MPTAPWRQSDRTHRHQRYPRSRSLRRRCGCLEAFGAPQAAHTLVLLTSQPAYQTLEDPESVLEHDYCNQATIRGQYFPFATYRSISLSSSTSTRRCCNRPQPGTRPRSSPDDRRLGSRTLNPDREPRPAGADLGTDWRQLKSAEMPAYPSLNGSIPKLASFESRTGPNPKPPTAPVAGIAAYRRS